MVGGMMACLGVNVRNHQSAETIYSSKSCRVQLDEPIYVIEDDAIINVDRWDEPFYDHTIGYHQNYPSVDPKY